MNNNSYYISNASNPVELAELNVPFYNALVREMGCSKAYRELWVGENLKEIIKAFWQYKPGSDEMKIRKAKVVLQYEKFYTRLTGCQLE